ncbi:diaminobutyrate--2-oxoglutarate transaminase [Sphaerisporangium sp. NPDC051017]|uniref:diaminobutyrate--2-oxoglutarate transaminase n=1 Tax=Sphaerisporangium sp. NPDC051017 TaxID=3154636 RepID=UPI0034363044
MSIFDKLESEVRSYCRVWPAVFDRAVGSFVYDETGKSYLDFFSGAGALNYGHNNPVLKRALIDYLTSDGIAHALDMSTMAKRDFLETFHELVLAPRMLDYKVQFPGPTGANTVESALKLARKVTGRQQVISFTNAFHGMTLGALSVTGSAAKRASAGVPLPHTTPMPYDGFLNGTGPDFPFLEQLLSDSGSGLDRPSAVVVETVQGEGGVNVARAGWLCGLADLCQRYEILLIVDDVQMGCGRTGPFFSFEIAGITPDIVCLAKSIGAYGLPMALTLIRPDLDVWSPGEHNGTFRGNNLAFVAATAALREYWSDNAFERDVLAKGEHVRDALTTLSCTVPGTSVRGRGLVQGLVFADPSQPDEVVAEAFNRGLLVETSGSQNQVVKLMPPLTATMEELDQGLGILAESVRSVSVASA